MEYEQKLELIYEHKNEYKYYRNMLPILKETRSKINDNYVAKELDRLIVHVENAKEVEVTKIFELLDTIG